MYFLRELEILPLLLLLLLWGTGGWLMSLRWFDLEPHERGLIGFGLGLILSNWLANFLARVVSMPLAFWLSGVSILILGLFSAWPIQRELIRPPWKGQGFIWLLFAGTALLLTLMGRGLGMFDDSQVLSTASIMATGDIPPHLPGAPDVRYGYHYFLILLGVQFMRVAAAPPWTALDLARGLTLALAIFLVGLLAFRLTRNKTVAGMSAVFYAFAGGTRWLLLFLPGSVLNRISASITLSGSGRDTGSNFLEALASPWQAFGSGPVPFPFAFGNGVHDPSVMAHYGYGVSAGLIMLMLLLLANRQTTWKTGIPFTILFASLALANEVDFVLLYLGILLVGAIWVVQHRSVRPPRSAWFWMVVTILAGILSMIQGGLLTEIVRGLFQPKTVAGNSYFTVGFSLVPPAVVAAHLGKLSLFHPYQLLAALFELGPVILLLPLVWGWGYEALRQEKWIPAALAVSTIPSLFSIFIEYSGNANVTATTRLLLMIFFVCKILGIPLLWLWLQNQPEWQRTLSYGLAGAVMLSGIVFFAIQLIAIPRPVSTYFLTDMDTRMYERYWNRLSPPSAWVLDPDSSRAPIIFGSQADSVVNWGVNTDEYAALLGNPDPYQVHAAGYNYIYADKEYWKVYATQLNQPCVNVLDTVEGVKESHGDLIPDFRRLADISECK